MKPGGQYRKGANAERWLVKRYKEHGATHAMRTAGSHSPFDVIALFKDHTEVVQIKAGRKPTREDTSQFLEAIKHIAASPYLVNIKRGKIKVVWMVPRGFHSPLLKDEEAEKK